MTALAVKARDAASSPARRPGLPLTILLLGIACYGTALAATNTGEPCGHVADLQSLQVATNDLTVNVVGHSVVESDAEAEETLAALDNSLPGQTSAPVLYLAPRVAVILQDIFSAVAIETPTQDRADEQQAYAIDAPPENHSPRSPVASDAAAEDVPEPGDPASDIEDMADETSFLRQMYRTDI